jgi:hypothetical protein
MINNVFKIFFVMSILISIPLSAYPQDNQGPKMVLKEKVFDFGKVRQGEVIKHAFSVLNKGDQPLKIIRVKPG